MKHNEINQVDLDEKVSQYLQESSFKTSRRGVVAKLSKLVLGLVGVSVVSGLPIDREVVVSAQGPNCSDWDFCGMCGWFCSGSSSCCPSSSQHGSTLACPGCTTQGGSWTLCCFNPDECEGVGHLISYYDCCGGSTGDTSSCQGASCCNSPTYTLPTAPSWCSPYRCTIIAIGGTCSS
jgi:hypothetical protein